MKGILVRTSNNTAVKVAVISALVCLLVYLRALSCGFVNYDDPQYVLDNPFIRRLDWNFLTSVFTQTYENWWMPLTWISLAIDYHFWELNPFGYHLTNIVLHAVNTGLVVLIADALLRDERRGMRGESVTFSPLSSQLSTFQLYPFFLLLAGLLWGIHPLRVESVVWVTERKDVLNGLFALGSIRCYLRYVQLKESGRAKIFSRYYLLALGLFSLSLMAKSVTVVIPLVMLVLDWFPLERAHKDNIKTVLIEKIPFFIISVAIATGTVFFISEARYLISNENFPFGQRLVVSGNALFEYCRLMLFPFGIVPIHFIPDPIPLAYSVKSTLVVLLMVLCLYTGKKNGALSAILLCYVLLLLPVLAFFQNGDQSFASRFTYLPSVAPSIAIAYGAAFLFKDVENGFGSLRFLCLGFAAFALVFFIGMTQRLIPVWNNSETFWDRIVEVEPSALAFKERAHLFVQMKKYNAAVDDYTAAIKNPLNVWKPYIYNLYAFRGVALSLAGRNDEAVNDFTTAIGMLQHPAYYRSRAVALRESGRISEAEVDLKRAGDEIVPIEWYWIKVESKK